MIRLIIILVALLLFWILFFSKFEQKQKIIASICLLAIATFGLWFEQRGETPRLGLIEAAQIEQCGLQASHTYRSNYDFEICLKNNSAQYTVRRLVINVIAKDCQSQPCKQIQTVNKAIPIIITPNQSATIKENLNFKKVDAPTVDKTQLNWSLEIGAVKAVK